MCKVYYTQLYFYVLDFKSNDDLLSFRSWRHISFWQFTFTIYKPFVRLRNRKAKELLIANSIHSLSQYIATDYLGSKTYQTNAIWKIKFLPSYSFKALHWNSLTSLRIWIWYLLRCLLSSAFSKFHLLGLRYQENIKWYRQFEFRHTTISFYSHISKMRGTRLISSQWQAALLMPPALLRLASWGCSVRLGWSNYCGAQSASGSCSTHLFNLSRWVPSMKKIIFFLNSRTHSLILKFI